MTIPDLKKLVERAYTQAETNMRRGSIGSGGGVSQVDLILARVFDLQGAEKGIGGFIVIRDPEKGTEPRGLRVAGPEPTTSLRGMPVVRTVIGNIEVADDLLEESHVATGHRARFGLSLHLCISDAVSEEATQGECRRIATAIARLGNGGRQ